MVVNDLGASLDGQGEEKTPADQVVDEILTKGGAIRVPVETVLTFSLDKPLRVTAVE